MDENAPGPSSSPPPDHAESDKPVTPSKSWSSFASVPPPPPAPFGHDSGESGHSSLNGAVTVVEAAFRHLNGDIDGDEVEEVDDLDALLFGSTSFLASEEQEQEQHLHFHHHQSTDEDDLDALLYGSTSLLSLAAGKDEEVSMAFLQETVKDDSPSTVLFRAINQPRVPLNGRHQNGSSSSSNTQLTQHVFTVTSASPSPPSPLSGEGPKLKPDETFQSTRKPFSNNPHNPPPHPPEEDDEEHTSSSLQNHKTDDEIPVISSNSLSDSGGVSEEDARISSGPFCSTASHVPEHTLSDISGPCSSSIVDKVPASFNPGDDESVGSICGAAKITGVKHHQKPLSHQLEIKASTSASAAAIHSVERLRSIHDSSTTSTSSLSDSDEEDNNGCHRVLSRSRCGSLKDQDGLPFPPPPPILLGVEEDEAIPMTVDTCEDYWTRLHDIRINGCILEYMGIGKSIHDNGFAQSSVPLTPLSHYFEITILDPGEYCYISIGLARKDYNVHKNPGWCRGSIAYHADDGKIFIGGGVGTPFGPKCTSNDVLGCGIVFPAKYGELLEGSSWPWEVTEEKKGEDAAIGKSKDKEPSKPRLTSRHNRRKIRVYPMDNFGDVSSESEDDIWWNNKNQVCEDKVKVFFMRNRKLLGIKEVRIPKGGFYPTIGMMSTNERVSVDLHPLTG